VYSSHVMQVESSSVHMSLLQTEHRAVVSEFVMPQTITKTHPHCVLRTFFWCLVVANTYSKNYAALANVHLVPLGPSPYRPGRTYRVATASKSPKNLVNTRNPSKHGAILGFR
jgi:hypothetical protein